MSTNDFDDATETGGNERQKGASLVHRHRPKVFGDVKGQDIPVSFLSGLILRGPVCRNVLLHGSIGSGKTTLARIYAKALNCELRSPQNASPCLNCESCRAIDAGDEARFAEIDTPRIRSPEDLKAEITRLLSLERRPGTRRVIFIDEAHSLSNPRYRGNSDFLLKQVEEPPHETSFCFATTAPEELSDALKSRLVPLRLRPLSVEQSVNFLAEIGQHEGIPFEPEALALIASFGEGQPRNMLQALDQVSDGGLAGRLEVTRDRVIDMFGVSRTEHLCRYFLALGEGNFARQTKVFFDWNEPVQLKLRLIQNFLLSLYYNELCGLKVTIDPLIASIRPAERMPIVDAFRQRLPSVDLSQFWEDMMAVLPVVTPAISDEALNAHIVAFQRVAGRPEAAPRRSVAPDRIPQNGPPQVNRARRARAGGQAARLVRIPKLKRDPNYLSMENVAQLIRASSFVVQEYGIRFNAHISVRHAAFGSKTQDEAAEHLATFSKALDSRLKAWTGSGHRICVQEVNEVEGFCGRIVAHVPNDARFVRWSERWERGASGGTPDGTAIRIEFVSPGPRLEGHWRCVRWLCGGLDPREPWAERLGIEPEFRRVAGDIGQRTRMPISDSLKSAGIKKAESELGLAALSAFDDEAWDRLYDGWELDEHLSRQTHKQLREKALDEVRGRYEPIETPEKRAALEAELTELKNSWPGRYARDRSWRLWEHGS
ncbi:ATP-binding protein [Bradyrhizobium elkanii]|uniref:DNA polymerase III subunit n=1 Tax=Bradyrhizobium elkanii TaxID=29448 RepID=UPI00057112C6|nr:AAA family ATPase [Bradyrhizobium elkanii]